MILIVDDDIAVRTSLVLLLKNEGFDALASDSAEDALQKIKTGNPELIILDLNFSLDTSGKEGMMLLKQIRQLNPSTPIILITGWGSIYYEFGISILFSFLGFWFAAKNPTNRNVFLIIFGLTTLYFAGSMVRLLVLLAPAFAILVAIGAMGLIKPSLTLIREAKVKATTKSKRGIQKLGKEHGIIVLVMVFLILMSTYAFMPQTGGEPRVYGSVYGPITISAASLPLGSQLTEPVPQWRNLLSYTRTNLKSTDVVASWWDYGDWLGMYGNVTTLCDNTTTNTTQIENVAYAMMANETLSIQMLSHYQAKYVLVFVTVQLA
jgi:asparagine N-glycosylation enzyme membrane subunit Stt3